QEQTAPQSSSPKRLERERPNAPPGPARTPRVRPATSTPPGAIGDVGTRPAHGWRRQLPKSGDPFTLSCNPGCGLFLAKAVPPRQGSDIAREAHSLGASKKDLDRTFKVFC